MKKKEKHKKRKRSLPVRIILTILKVVVIAVPVLLALVLILVAIYMPDNKKAMNRGVTKALKTIRSHADVKEIDAGEYGKLRIYGIMNFDVHQYEVEGIGHLSTMTMNAGLMQMSTVILTPTDKDMPLISTDYMYILGNRTSYLECYDLVLDKGSNYQAFLKSLRTIKKDYADLDTMTPSSAWYDSMRSVGLYMKGKKADDQTEEKALTRWLDAALSYANGLPSLTEEQKKEKAPVVREYTDGLIEQGGVSTDLFVKAKGREWTRNFFNEVLFGTK